MTVLFLPRWAYRFMHISPAGSEGSTYALLTTISSVAQSVGSNIATLLTRVWDVSNETLSMGDFTGMWKLTVLTAVIPLVSLFALRLLPRGVEDLQERQVKDTYKSVWAGRAFVLFLVVAWLWTVVETCVLTAEGKAGGD